MMTSLVKFVVVFRAYDHCMRRQSSATFLSYWRAFYMQQFNPVPNLKKKKVGYLF
jgi:hypothetical protein